MNDFQAGAPNIYPVLTYRSAPGAIAWLTRVFGFKEQLLVPDGEGDYAHVELSLGAGIVMLNSGSEGTTTDWGPYVVVPDIEAHYAQAKAEGAEITREMDHPEHDPGGVYSARDLDGYEWSFGGYQPIGEE